MWEYYKPYRTPIRVARAHPKLGVYVNFTRMGWVKQNISYKEFIKMCSDDPSSWDIIYYKVTKEEAFLELI